MVSERDWLDQVIDNETLYFSNSAFSIGIFDNSRII